MKNNYPCHKSNLVSLKRVEGQVRGVQRMIEEKKYCVDILIQVNAAIGALVRVQDKILEKHLRGCVAKAVMGKSSLEKEKKLEEVFGLISRFRKGYK